MQDIETQIIRFPVLQQILGMVSRSSIDRWELADSFPKRIKLGKNSVGWRLSDVKKWLQERSNAK